MLGRASETRCEWWREDGLCGVGNIQAPYKYDLGRFHAMNTVTVDHPDPSIFTALQNVNR